MTVRFGINPIGWTDDCMRWLGDLIPLDVCLAEARSAGFEGVELGRKFPRRANELGPLLDRHGLKLVSGGIRPVFSNAMPMPKSRRWRITCSY